VDAQGRFEIKALPLERSFSMVFTAKGFGHDTCTVEPPEGEPKRVEMEPVHLPAADQQIAGVVLDPDDKPVRGANLYSIGDNKQPVTRGQTDSKGRFHFKQVCAGPMQIFVNSQNGLNGNATVEGGDTNIIIHISTPVGMRAKVASVSLQGKPLPDLAPLGLTATDAPANQRVLAVLIDAEQRPSKRVLKRITDLADPLKEKGVSVVVLHAGTLDGAAFDAWKKEAALPFPIGVFKGNREKTRAAWGTASLPWLVLTDANHQVTDEGFAAGELDEKLNLTGK